MENAQPKRTNWGMIILVIVLVPILILGSIFGYKYLSKKMDDDKPTTQESPVQNNEAANSNEGNNTDYNSNRPASSSSNFDMVGDWYFNDHGAVIKYVFSQPHMSNGTLQGQLTMLMDGYSKGGPVNYAVEDNNRLKLSETDNSVSWVENYFYDPNTETLSLTNNEGNKRTFYRNEQAASNAAASNNNNSYKPPTTAAENRKINTSQLIPNPVGGTGDAQLKAVAAKLMLGKWQKYIEDLDRLTTVTFSKLKFENGMYVLESVMEISEPTGCRESKTFRRVTLMPGGKYKVLINGASCDGKADASLNGRTSEWFYEFFTDRNGNQALLIWNDPAKKSQEVAYTLRK